MGYHELQGDLGLIYSGVRTYSEQKFCLYTLLRLLTHSGQFYALLYPTLRSPARCSQKGFVERDDVRTALGMCPPNTVFRFETSTEVCAHSVQQRCIVKN